jgi:hypothetical protein
MKKTLITLALFAAGAVQAQTQWSLQLHGASHHEGPRGNGLQWNERNVGAGVRAQFNPDWGVQAGAYDNSYNKTTVYALAQYTPLPLPFNGRAGVFGGYASNYPTSVPAIAGLMASWPVYKRVHASVRYVPRVGGDTVAVWAFEVGVQFK